MFKLSQAALLAAALCLSAPVAMAATSLPSETAEPAAAPDVATPAAPPLSFGLSVPTVIAVGSSMDETALRDALGSHFLDHVEELGKLTATSITIPTITVTIAAGGPTPSTSTVTYKDTVLSNIKDGLAADITIGSAESVQPDGTFTYGRMEQKAADFRQLFAFLGLIGDESDAFKPGYASFTTESGTFTSKEVSCTIGRSSAAGVALKPVKTLFKDVVGAFEQISQNPDNPPATAMRTLFSYVGGLLVSIKSEPISIEGVACTGTSPDGKPVGVKIGGISVDGFAPGVYPAFTITDLAVTGEGDGTLSLGSFVVKSTDLNGPIAAIQDPAATLDKAWFEANYRKLIPAFGGLAASDFAMDVPDNDNPGKRIKASFGSFDLTLSDYLNGVPTRLSSSAKGVDVMVPPDSTEEQMQQLLALGITEIRFGYDFSAGWDKATSTIKVDKMALDAENFGALAIAATIGNAPEQLFDVDADTAMGAALGVTVQDLKIDLTDAGLGDMAIQLAATDAKADPAQYRASVAAAAEGAVIALLGATDEARALGKAIGDFVGGKARSISIDVVAKDPAGLPLDLLEAASNDPSVLAGQVEVTGTAK